MIKLQISPEKVLLDHSSTKLYYSYRINYAGASLWTLVSYDNYVHCWYGTHISLIVEVSVLVLYIADFVYILFAS